MRKRRLKQNLFVALCTLSTLITASLLIIIVGFIFMRGYSELNLKFIITPEFTLEGAHMGVANAIAGTLILSISSVILATPLAIAVAIYLAEYAKENIFTKTLRFLIDLLAGIPAIVIGAIGFLILVVELRNITGGFSLIAGTISLSILVMPTIERTAEEALKRTPGGIKEASYALGSTKWQMIKRVVIPYSFPGIVTGRCKRGSDRKKNEGKDRNNGKKFLHLPLAMDGSAQAFPLISQTVAWTALATR